MSKESEERYQVVVKGNEIVQRAKYDLSNPELKTLAYILSKIKPTDGVGTEYSFSISDFCKVCGMQHSGSNYEMVKNCLKGLRDKSVWVKDTKGREHTMGWLGYVTLSPGDGTATVELDKRMQKYLFGVFSQYTQYELISILPMQSSYSIRMYELLKSYSNLGEHTFDIDDLKEQLFAKQYANFKDFRKRVIESSVKEINQYTDIEVKWEPITHGRKVIGVKFNITVRNALEKLYYHKLGEEEIMHIVDED